MNDKEKLDLLLETARMILKDSDEYLKDYIATKCCEKNTELKHVFKTPEARQIYDNLVRVVSSE